jgi:hypothetical protein
MEEVKLAEVISRVIQAVLGDLIPVTEFYRNGEFHFRSVAKSLGQSSRGAVYAGW